VTHYALASYRAAETVNPALVLGNSLYDLRATWALCSGQAKQPDWLRQDVAGLIGSWPAVEPSLSELAQVAEAARLAGRLGSAARELTQLAAPFVPARIFCAASNYIEHANEMGTVLAAKATSRPYMFLKTASSVIGPNEVVRIPPETSKPDWEVELAAVIGRRARRVAAHEALSYVAGYTIVNDVSARDLTRRTDWFQGKNHDT
jgi:2-keto-4-pentenoate hydratase/2-oxohepta-3-ene-1,7-dioic acid hydratase in catechol pathway